MSQNHSSEDLNNPETWKINGNDFFNKGLYEDAAKCYSHAIELDPKYIDAWNNLGLALLKLGKIEEAKKCNSTVKNLKFEAQSIEIPIQTEKTYADEIREKYVNAEITYNQYQNYLKGNHNNVESDTAENSNIASTPSLNERNNNNTNGENEKSKTKPIHWIIGIIIVIGSLVLFGLFGLLITIFICLFYVWWQKHYSPSDIKEEKKQSDSNVTSWIIVIFIFLIFLMILGAIISSIGK